MLFSVTSFSRFTMFRQIYNREIGHRKQNLLPCQKLPDVAASAFLERFETADKVHLYQPFSDYEFDLMIPMACNFGTVKSNLLGVSDEMGKMVIFNTDENLSSNTTRVVRELDAHSNAIFDFQWVDNDTKLLTASGDQTAALWDVECGESISTFRGHFCSVRSVSSDPRNSALLATGARDGHILFWDSRIQTKVDRTHGEYRPAVKYICNAHSIVKRTEVKAHRRNFREKGPILFSHAQDTQQSVTCLQYLSDHLLMSSGSVDGSIKVWDLRKSYTSMVSLPTPLQCFTYPGTIGRRPGVICFTLDKTQSRVFATYTDHAIYCFDLATGDKNPVSVFKGHRCDTYYVKTSMSPDGRYLLSGSTNSNAYIWEVNKPEKAPVVLKGHMSDVGGVSWHHRDLTKLATVGDDSMLLIWHLPKHEPSEEKQRTFGYAESLKAGKKQQKPGNICRHGSLVSRSHLDPRMMAKLCSRSPGSTVIASPSVQTTPEPLASSQVNVELNVYHGSPTAASTPPHMCVVQMRDKSIVDQEKTPKPGTCCPVTVQEDVTPGRKMAYPPLLWVGSLGRAAGTDESNTSGQLENERAVSVSHGDANEAMNHEPKENIKFHEAIKAGTCLYSASAHVSPSSLRLQKDSQETGVSHATPVKCSSYSSGRGKDSTAKVHSTTLKRKLYTDMDDTQGEGVLPGKFLRLSAEEGNGLAEQRGVSSVRVSLFTGTESSVEDSWTASGVAKSSENSPTSRRQCLLTIDTNSPTKTRSLASPCEAESSACLYFNRVAPKPQMACSPHSLPKSVLFTPPGKTGELPARPVFYSPTMNLPNRAVDPPMQRTFLASTSSDPAPKTDWLTGYRLSLSTTPISKTTDSKKSAATPSPNRTRRVRTSTPKSKENHVTPRNSPCASKKAGMMSVPVTPKSAKKEGEDQDSCSSIQKTPGNRSIRHYFQ